MNHICWVINFFSFVKYVKSFQVLTFAVAFYLFFMLLIFRHSAKNRSLAITTFAFYENLCFTRKFGAFLAWMAVLTTTMTTIWSNFFTKFFTWMMLMSLLATFFVTLNSTFVTTLKSIRTFV